jgi:lipoate-protein ligase A
VDWHVVADAPAAGEENMRRDIALAEEAARTGAAFLRIYGWRPPAVSIGRNQRPEEACDLSACAALGWDVVRRPTGGRAVLHAADEVTYCMALPAAAAPPGVLAAYAWLAQGLLAAYRLLGLPAALAEGRHLEERSGACFDAAAAHEVLVEGRKVAGSAQVRRGGYLLQHGALPVTFDAALHVRLLGLPAAAAPLLRRRAAGIADLLDPAPSRAEIVAALAAGVRQALGGPSPNRGAAGGSEGRGDVGPATRCRGVRGGGQAALGRGAGDPRTEPEPARPA